MLNVKNKAYNIFIVGFFDVLISYVLMYAVCAITFDNLTIFPFSHPTIFLILCSICIGMISYTTVYRIIRVSSNKAYIYSPIFFYLIFLILSFIFRQTHSFVLPQLLVVLFLIPAMIIQTILFSCKISFRSINNK